MKLVLYAESNAVLEVIEDLRDIEVEADAVTWRDGSLRGIKAQYIIVPDDAEVGAEVSAELIAQDQAEQFRKIDLAEENRQLKERLDFTELALINVMDMM
ncbi:hypothetical protein AB685_14780 [Bacillus sp. LL01]|uniref:hypothetical protein n=1 Tax=Bacillus sp. LL01 TaxID=1665556 RepID=UPI00064D4C13|nr:hypothetical protein [Bacillus sp. LL01]KMJ58073.1 hypothetical protein AB685_14780 [Bacillus sp. LL01]